MIKKSFSDNKIFNFILAVCCFAFVVCFSGCARKNNNNNHNFSSSNCGSMKQNDGECDKKINIATTNFPLYDFLRQIVTENVNLKMLMAPGVDSHSFEPTAETVKLVENSNVLVCLGGGADSWVENVLNSIGAEKKNKINQIDIIQKSSQNNAASIDSHVWTSLQKSINIVRILQEKLSKIDSENAAIYSEKAELFISKLSSLKNRIEKVVAEGKRKVLVFAGKFPFKHFTDEFGLSAVTAFANCSSKSEALPSKVLELVNFIKTNNVPMVLHSDFDESNLAEVVAGETNVKIGVLHACHTVSANDFAAGKTYLDFMEQNLETLKEALN